MNATEIKVGKRYLAKINYSTEIRCKVIETKVQKGYSGWQHKVEYDFSRKKTYDYSNRQYVNDDTELTTPITCLVNSGDFIYPIDENNEKIMTAAYLRKQNEQVQKLLAKQEREDKIQEFLLNMSLAGVECWRTRAHQPGKYYGSKVDVIAFHEDDFETVNKLVDGNLSSFLDRITE